MGAWFRYYLLFFSFFLSELSWAAFRKESCLNAAADIVQLLFRDFDSTCLHQFLGECLLFFN